MSQTARTRALLLGLCLSAALPVAHAPRAGAAAAPAPALLPAPQWVGATDARGKAQLTWIRNPAFSLVRIYRKTTEPGREFARVTEVRENSFLDAGVTPGQTYRYRLVGVGPDGREGQPSAELSVRIAAVAYKPPAPPAWEGFLLFADGVGLKWFAREEEDVIAYNVYRAAPADPEFRLVGSSRGTSFRDTGLEPGRTYRYVLTALDSGFRETPRSAELVVKFAAEAPTPEKKRPEAVWRVRRTRLVALVPGGDVPFLRPADAAYGPVSGSIYVSDSGRNRVFVFSPQGAFQRAVGVGATGMTAFRKVLGVALDRDETLYVADAGAGAVQTFTPLGLAARRIEIPRPREAAATGIIDVAVGADGGVFVVDNLNNQVTIAGREGALRTFGRQGPKGGEFSAPTFCATGPDGSIYVADALNARVQVFSPGGEFVRAFGRYAKAPGGFGRPKGVAVSAAGEIFVADSWLNTVQVFDASGQFLALLGDETGRPLDLGSPNGIALGPGNRIAIAERLAGRLQIREVLGGP
jgi:sugar lactone lactonase YvrE